MLVEQSGGQVRFRYASPDATPISAPPPCSQTEPAGSAACPVRECSHGHHDLELVAFLHRDHQVAEARERVRDMVRELLSDGAEVGELRSDVAPDELATYCLHALMAARSLPSKIAVRRLVRVTLGDLRAQT